MITEMKILLDSRREDHQYVLTLFSPSRRGKSVPQGTKLTVFNQVFIVGRGTVLNEIGGCFVGPLGESIHDRLAFHDDAVYGECNFTHSISSAKGQALLRPFLTTSDVEDVCLFIPKHEEEKTTTYGDVAFSWPVKDKVKRAKNDKDNFARQVDINSQIMGGNNDLFSAIIAGGGSVTICTVKK